MLFTRHIEHYIEEDLRHGNAHISSNQSLNQQGMADAFTDLMTGMPARTLQSYWAESSMRVAKLSDSGGRCGR